MEGLDPWAPFSNEEEWQLARWLMKNVGQSKTDEFLRLPIVSCLDFLPTPTELTSPDCRQRTDVIFRITTPTRFCRKLTAWLLALSGHARSSLHMEMLLVLMGQ